MTPSIDEGSGAAKFCYRWLFVVLVRTSWRSCRTPRLVSFVQSPRLLTKAVSASGAPSAKDLEDNTHLERAGTVASKPPRHRVDHRVTVQQLGAPTSRPNGPVNSRVTVDVLLSGREGSAAAKVSG
jgi:hypothetical protein